MACCYKQGRNTRLSLSFIAEVVIICTLSHDVIWTGRFWPCIMASSMFSDEYRWSNYLRCIAILFLGRLQFPCIQTWWEIEWWWNRVNRQRLAIERTWEYKRIYSTMLGLENEYWYVLRKQIAYLFGLKTLLWTYSDPDASNTWLRQKKILYQDVRITKFEIFFDFFEGEEWIINSTMTFNFINDHRPMGCLCWRNWFSCFQHRVPYVSRRVVWDYGDIFIILW